MRTLIAVATLAALSLSLLPACGGQDTSALSADALQASEVCATHACCPGIVALDGQTAAVTLLGRNAEKDRAALRNDLLNVSVDIEKGGHEADAISTLLGYWTDVMKLSTCDRLKLAAADADTLLTGVEGSILCIDPAFVLPLRSEFVCPIRVK